MCLIYSPKEVLACVLEMIDLFFLNITKVQALQLDIVQCAESSLTWISQAPLNQSPLMETMKKVTFVDSVIVYIFLLYLQISPLSLDCRFLQGILTDRCLD